jgi:hypothetical protein
MVLQCRIDVLEAWVKEWFQRPKPGLRVFPKARIGRREIRGFIDIHRFLVLLERFLVFAFALVLAAAEPH